MAKRLYDKKRTMGTEKKPLITVPLVLFCVILMGCGNEVKNDVSEDASKETVSVVNPMKELSHDDVLKQMGVDLVAPQGANNQEYFIYDLGEEGKVAELRFSYEEKDVYIRAKNTDELDVSKADDISGLYFSNPLAEDVNVGSENGKLTSGDGMGFVTWIDGDSNLIYCLGMIKDYSKEYITKLAALCYDTFKGTSQVDSNLIGINKRFYHDECVENDVMLAFVDYATIEIDESYLNSNSKLSAVIEELNNSIIDECVNTFERQSDDARELNEYDSEYPVTLSYGTDFNVMRADSRVLSLVRDIYPYEGGAHGMYYEIGVTYDLSTGKEISLEDVVKDIAPFEQLIVDKLYEKYGNEEFYNLEDSISYYFEEPSHLFWSLGYKGITFYFAPYELASYAAGAFSVSILFEENPELFEAEYTNTPDYYMIPFVGNELVGFENEREITNLMESTSGGDFYRWDDFLFHTPEGNYIVSCQNSSEGVRQTDIYRVSSEAIDYMYTIEGKTNRFQDFECTMSNPFDIKLFDETGIEYNEKIQR